MSSANLKQSIKEVMLVYFFVFLFSLLVDLIPFIGPPAWTVMVFLYLKYDLNIWVVLVCGVIGSAIGRYLFALYIPYISSKVLNARKETDLHYLGDKLSGNKWRTQAFVLFYTLIPVPSSPLFTVAGLAKIHPIRIIPAFFAGKFISDAIMVNAGKYAAVNIDNILKGFFSIKALMASIGGVSLLFFILFIDWRILLQHKRFKLNFSIWK
jgi:membrane protein YqaA with SNARE-associated domain